MGGGEEYADLEFEEVGDNFFENEAEEFRRGKLETQYSIDDNSSPKQSVLEGGRITDTVIDLNGQ
jgi:hypothetical protein